MDNEIKKQKGTSIRTIAAILYAIFALFQILTLHAFVGKAALTGVSILAIIQISEAIGAIIFSVWLFGSTDYVSKKLANQTISATALLMITDLLFITDSGELIDASLTNDFAFLSKVGYIKFIFIALRLVLLILAAFFIVYSLKGPEKVILETEDNTSQTDDIDVVEEILDNTSTKIENNDDVIVVEETVIEPNSDDKEEKKED